MASFAEYTKKKKKSSFREYTGDVLGIDIAPIKQTTYTVPTTTDIAPVKTTKKDDKKLDFFKKVDVDDGWDVAKAILGTAGDAGVGVVKGIASLGEGIGDLASYGIAGIVDAFGKDDRADEIRRKTQQSAVDEWFKGTDEYLDKYSVLGRTSDAIMQGLGQVGGIIGTAGIAGALGAGGAVTTAATTGVVGLSSTGSGMSEAYQSGATDKEALVYGISSGVVDAGTEMLFGGLGKTVKAVGLSKGIGGLDDMFAQKLSSKISSQVAKNFVEYGVKASGEGFEEVLAGVGSAAAKKLTYMDEKELNELISDENLLEQFVVGTAASGMMQSGYIPKTSQGSLKEANKTGRDFISGYTQNEQSVIDAEVEKRIKNREKDGEKLGNKEVSSIKEQVEKDLEKGYIDIDTIESVLGGETYKSLKSVEENETKLQEEHDTLKKEYDELNKMKLNEMTGEQTDRREELKSKLAELKQELKNKSESQMKSQIRSQLDSEMSKIVEGSKLSESYNERARRGQTLEVDLESYTNENAKQTAKNYAENYGANNTNASHDFLDMLTHISEDRGHTFDFTTTAKLEESIKNGNPYNITVDPDKVEAFVDGKSKTIVLNMDANKSLSSLVGHEVMHTLEGANSYKPAQDALFEYAKAMGEYNDRWASIQRRYKNLTEEQQLQELASDLAGDYVFGDQDFVRNLSTQNPNVFQKIYNEIKYLWKMATAGSKEARELERVKRTFEKVWQEANEATPDSEVKFSIREEAPPKETGIAYKVFYVKDGKLYPPMVANPDGADTPMGVWLNADVGKEAAPSKTGRQQVKAGGKGTQGGSGSLAFRPGWHLGDLPRASQFDRTNPETGAKELFPKDFVWAEVEYAKDVDYQEEAMSYGYTDNGKFRHAYAGLPRLPENGYYRYRTNPKPDTVPWIITGAMKVNRLLSDAEVNSILEQNGVQPVHRQGGDVGLDAFGFNEDGSVVKTDGESEVKYSLANDTQYMDNAIAKNNASLMVDQSIMEEAKVLREKIASRMNEIKDTGLVGIPEDIEGNTFISNSSYGGTEENTTICPRSLAAESFVDAVSEYMGRPLTVEEQIYISQDLQGRSLTPECTYCYVATDRKAYRAFLGEYVSQRDSVIDKIKANPDADVSRSGELYNEFLNGRKDTNPMYKRFKMWVDAYKNGTPMIDASHLANMSKLMGDINSEFGAALKPQIVDAMKYAQSASWAKKRVNYVAYNGHILKWKQDRINKLNSHYGLRMYSFSDFHPAFTLENMQMITDASVRGLKMLGYTKDTDFVEIFAPSGMNINISTFGFVKDGVIAENNLIGAEWQRAKELRDQYPNVGITFVATDDTLVNWALDQDWIDVVIPFHLVRTGKEVAKAFKYHDYTSESSDTKTSEWKKGDEKYIAPTEHNNDKATYLSALEKNHLRPRFERFVDHPNYMKLVNECRLSASEGKPVKPVFNEDAAMKALAKLEVNGYYQPVGGSVDRMYEIAAEVAENMQSELAPTQNRIADDDLYASKEYGRHTYAKDIAIEGVAPTAPETTVGEMPIRNDYAPLTEDEANVRDDRQIDEHYFMDDMPTDTEDDLYNGTYAAHMTPSDPFYEKDIWEVGKNRKQKAYMYENPEVKPFFQEEARYMLGELNNSQKGEKFYNDQLYYDTNGEMGWFGTQRFTSEDIAYLLDTFNYTYKDIEKGLNAIIEDNGKENNAISKRIEFLLDERLRTGYTEFMFGEKIPPNQDYINLLNSKEITQYNDESWNNWLRGLSEEDIKYLSNTREDIAPQQEYMSAEPKVLYAEQDIAPVKEEVPLYDAQLRKGVVEGQQSMFDESKTPRTITRSYLHKNIIKDIKTTFSEEGFDLDDVLNNAKNLSTFSTVDNTPQRVMEKALGYKQGQVLSDLTVNKVAQNESKGTKWLNSFTDRKNGLLAQISKQYKIKPGSKESAAAQMYAEGFYVNDNNEIIEYGDAELTKDFPDPRVRENIKGLANDDRIRRIYDETLSMINESRTRNAYPEIPRLDNYFLHFRAMDDTFSRLGLPFNPNDIRAKDLPTDLNGVTADLKPGQPFFSSQFHRTGKRTSFDLLGGLERYLTSAKNQIYHIDDIQTLRALRNYIADTYGQANGLENLDVLSEEEAQQRIEQVYSSHLSTFAKFLNEEANVLAGKTTLIDRGIEGIIGRRGITFLDTVNKQVGSNMVGFNVSSSLTNVLPVVQTFAKTNKADFVKAFSQTVHNKISSMYGKNDGFADQSPVMIRRKGADRFYRTPFQKVGDTGYVFMSAIDEFSTELIARTKHNELTRKGMDAQKAHYETDKWVSRLMGDRSLGQMPQLYNSKMLGLFTKFQLEVRNQLDSQFYDTIQEAKVSSEHIQNGLAKNAKTAAKVASAFAQLAVAQHLFGSVFESIAGYNPAFDIIEVLLKTVGYDDDEDSEDTALDNVEQGFLALLEDLPYTSTLTGGRIPISQALPVKELVTGVDEYGNEKSRWDTLGEVAPYYVLPTGYGQIKKSAQGLKMFDEDLPISGSYTDSGNLRFPIEDTPKNRLQAGVFGQYASDVARDYFDNERSPLKEKQIQEYIDVDIPIRDYWEYREGLSGLKTLSDKADYINSLDLPIDKKNILVNNQSDRKEPIDLTGFDEDYENFEEFDFAVNNPEKYEIVLEVGGYKAYKEYKEGMKDMKIAEKIDYVANLDLTIDQKNALINGETDRKEPIDLTGYENYNSYEEFELAKESPKKYSVSRVIGYDDYVSYMDVIGDIRADKDSNGKTINGSAKRKKTEYINSLDLDYGQRIILYRSLFDSESDKDEYNADIVEYLNSREDITSEEMLTILESLDMKVLSDGTVTW